MIVAGTGVILSNLRNRALADSERELQNIVLVLAEQTDRAFQALELVQKSLIERMQTLGIATSEDYERQMSSHDIHLMLKDKISGLPQVESVALFNSEGNLINFSRFWPIPALNVADRDHFKALESDAQLTSVVSAPVLNRTADTWTVYLARKFTGPNGEFLGLVIGGLELQYFERFFGTIALGEDSAISLFRRDGVLLARYPQRDSPGTSYARGPLFQNVLSRTNRGVVRLTSVFDGKERLIAGQRLAHYPVVVAAGRTVSAVLSEWQSAAIYTTVAAVLIVFVIGGIIFLSARQVGKKLGEKNLRLDTAIANMSQGLCMFDAEQRLIVCNDRYRQMYGLSPEQVKPGTTLRQIFECLVANGLFAGANPAEYMRQVVENRITHGGKAGAISAESVPERGAPVTAYSSHIRELSDGRTIAVLNQPMAGGGWVATHEDVTESKRHEASFRLLFENNPVPMWVYDLESLRFLAVNEAAVAHYGFSREQFMAMTLLDIRPAGERERLVQLVRTTGGTHQGEQVWRHQKSDGTRIEVAICSRALRYEGRAASLVAVHDVTARKLVEDELRRTRIFLDTVIENVPIPIFVKEASDLRYVLVNRAGENFWGTSRAEMIGRTSYDLFPKEEADLIAARDQHLLQSDQPSFDERQICTPRNGLRSIISKRLIVRNDAGKPQYLIGVIEDMTERKLAEARIAHMAHHDALTDLPNRVLLRERLEQALSHVRRGGRLAVLYLDLDNFKNINDTLGHPTGDELLKAVAERVRSCLRDTDTIARFGGDEFTIVQTALERPTDVAILAQRLRDTIKAPCELNDHQIVIDVSIGIAVSPSDGTDPDQLLKNADMALYRAKADGRGTYRFFEPEMDARMRARRTLEIDLRKALGDGEFELYYQPIVNLQRNEISGVEALLRWHHPERGMVSPAEFIPVAEEIGLIIPLGEWVLRQACAAAATWPDDIRVAVNLSPVQLRNRNLSQVIINALAASGVPARRLEIEVTEAVLLRNNQTTLGTLHQLRELGVRIAMDDFGTGYSSLSYLRSFPFDKIKIDRSFISDLSDGGDSIAIVRAVASLAASLNMTTTAEGVETRQQLEKVKALGCTEMQGYLFSPPRPAEEISRLFLPRAEQAASAA